MHRAKALPQLSRFAAAVWARMLAHRTDAAELTGAALVVYGVEMIYRPAGFILGGLVLVGMSYLSGVKR